MAIPKIIHSIWFQGWSQLPPQYNSNVQSVITNNPGYQYIKWDQDTIRKVVSDLGPTYLAKYDGLKIMHQKIDFGRYAILYTFGGISVDIDAMAHKGFDSTPHISDSDFIVSDNSTGKFINNATILVSAKNPLMFLLINSIDGDCKFYQSDFFCVLQTTGPFAFTRFIKSHLDSVTVLPSVYFEPCSGLDDNCSVSDKTILNHKHEQTWVNPLFKSVAEQYYKIKPYKNIFIIVFILLILFFVIKGLRK